VWRRRAEQGHETKAVKTVEAKPWLGFSHSQKYRGKPQNVIYFLSPKYGLFICLAKSLSLSATWNTKI
jgi:hypothetical protein